MLLPIPRELKRYGFRHSTGFTLVELLTVIAIIALLAAILFPVLSAAKQSAKRTTCVSNLRQTGMAALMYLSDFNDVYPQSRQHSNQPDVDDLSGAIDEPVNEPALSPLESYVSRAEQPSVPLFECPEDTDPFGSRCLAIDPDAPAVTSYLVNGYFVFGLFQSSVTNPSDTIYLAERRSNSVGDADPYCDDIYHPWFNGTNDKAPENEMDIAVGAVATTRHLGVSDFEFVDGHVKALPWGETYSGPLKDLHLISH